MASKKKAPIKTVKADFVPAPVVDKLAPASSELQSKSQVNLAPVRHFSSVKRARAALRYKADVLLEKYLVAIDMATASGKYEEALKAYQWLLDHIPGEDGKRLLDPSVDKQTIVESNKGPLIQIGFQLGGVKAPKELPIITVDPED